MKRPWTRRDFLKMVSAGCCGAALHNVLEPLTGTLAFALEPSRAALLGPQSVMVVINLAGGCSYNIAGAYNGAFRNKFPNISYGPPGDPRPSLPLTSDQGLHPALTTLKAEYDLGNLAVFNLVGLQGNPDFGHDTASDKWQTGLTSGSMSHGGWMARMTCQLGNAFGGISLGGTDTFTQGECNPPPSFGDLSNFGESSFWGTEDTAWLRSKRSAIMAAAEAAPSDAQRRVASSIASLEGSLDTISQVASGQLAVTFPTTGFGRACRDAARLIVAKSLGVRIIYLVKGGFDTHSNELNSHNSLFQEINGGLDALIATLKASGDYDRVVIATMSEFGRTFENSNMGTDHGYASPLLVVGGQISGGIHTPPPGAGDLTGNYIRNRYVDPREVYYQTVVSMGLDAEKVFPEPFSRVGVGLFK